MSMNAGGLAQMTYSDFSNNGGLGVPGSGFASRGKGAHIKHLSMPPQDQSGAIGGGQQSGAAPTPRTSRSHLLANLRTAPKSPSYLPSAPPTQLQHRTGLDSSRYADQDNSVPRSMAVPKTAIGSGFPSQQQPNHFPNAMATGRQMYSLPEQVLAPPAIQVGDGAGQEQMDPNLYAELMATNLYLAQQQQRLQQQLVSVTAAAQQFNGLGLNDQMGHKGQQQQQAQQFANAPVAQNTSFYNQQLQNGMQPMITPVGASNPGLYSIYNPVTGQQGFFMDANGQQPQYAPSPPLSSPENESPPYMQTPQFRAQVSPPPPARADSFPNELQRKTSSPKPSTSPGQATPSLPPPSANAFRRGHKKATSMAPNLNSGNSAANHDGPRTPGPKSAGFPQASTTGALGPGQSRAGEHPTRQPRGPPPLEELVALPTTKHEGSKNFATRQRRRAVHSLVRAGIERRGVRGHGSVDSPEGMTPASETDITFSISSDNDSDSLGSGSLSSKPSIGSLRAAANGAIGSERKEKSERSRERDTFASRLTAASVSSDEGTLVGGKLVEVRAEGSHGPNEVRKTPMLVLTCAEKRKSSLF
ncbi:MAG: hypothetical protein M1817_004115 [Caeruleum heppii]|nr:MAG: hypothetical protein M1817_004115 [Caeruleum heppii]